MTNLSLWNTGRSRSRGFYCLLAGVTIFLGLASRRVDRYLPGMLHKNTGDVLWAIMAFWLWALFLPRRSTAAIAGITALFSLCVELFKLFHTPWLDALRDTLTGRLIFGYAFSWSNLLCYLTGILIAAILDVRLTQNRALTTTEVQQ